MARETPLMAMGVACALLLLPVCARGETVPDPAATPRAADEPPPEWRRARSSPWTARPVAFLMSFGPRSPAGTWSGEIEWAQTRYTALAVGVGLAPSGPQISVMPRLLSPLGERLALGVGLGVSEGRFLWEGTDALGRACTGSTCVAGVRQWERAVWGNVELSLEERRAWGLAWRVYGGGGRLLNPGDGRCISDARSCTRESGVTVVFGGLSLGFAL